MRVTSPPVYPRSYTHVCRSLADAQAHSDRQAWPLGSPRVWAAFGTRGVLPGTQVCTVPAGFSVRQDVYLEVWKLLQCILWIQGGPAVSGPGHRLAPSQRSGHAAITAHMAVSLIFCHFHGHQPWALKRSLT